MGETVRWDTGRMAELAELLHRRHRSLHAARLRTLAAYESLAGSPAVETRLIVIAAEWAGRQQHNLNERRRRLLQAEEELLWGLDRPRPPHPTFPELRSRAPENIVAELEEAIATIGGTRAEPSPVEIARRELTVAELTLELAIAVRDQLLLNPHPPAEDQTSELRALIDYLGYEAATMVPASPADWGHVAAAVAAIRSALDETWFGDVSRGELRAITTTLRSLKPAELDYTIALLGEAELYRWLHELDGVRGGNLDPDEEGDLFRIIAERASPATLWRLAGAEGGSRFAEIAAAVRMHAPDAVAMQFIELCAAAAADGEAALVAALEGLAALDGRRRQIVLASLHLDGALDGLAESTAAFLERHIAERRNPVVVEFFAGLLGAIRDGALGMADLTVAGLVDRHRFREAWSDIGEVVGLAFTDPAEFASAVIDIEMMRRNPARWLGGAMADLTTAGTVRLARFGRLGRTARMIAAWLRRLGASTLARIGRVDLRLRHLVEVAGRLDDAASALEAGAVITATIEVGRLGAELRGLTELLDQQELPSAFGELRRTKDAIGRVAALTIETVVRLQRWAERAGAGPPSAVIR